MLDSDRQLADAAACGMEDRIGDGSGGPDLADLANPLDAERIDDVIANLDELHFDVWRVGVDRDEVLAQARVCPAAHLALHDGALEQGLAEPPQHPAHELAAGSLGIQYAAWGEGADHPPDAGEPEVGVDSDLRKLGTERHLRVTAIRAGGIPTSQRIDLFQEIALEQLTIGLAGLGLVTQHHPAVTHDHHARVGAMQRRVAVGDGPGDELVARGGCGSVDRTANHARSRRANRRGSVRQVRVPKLEANTLEWNAEPV